MNLRFELGNWQTYYRRMSAGYYALIVIAGLIIFFTQRWFWQQYTEFVPIASHYVLIAVLLYMFLDWIRILFFQNSILSLGFCLALVIVLSPSGMQNSVPMITAGSLVSEFLYSYYRYRRKAKGKWDQALGSAIVRALLYAGHHAIASFAASVAFFLANPELDLDPVRGWLALVVYVLVYSIASFITLWPHSRLVDWMLVSDETHLPRVELVLAMFVLAPIAAFLVYLFNMAAGFSQYMVYVLAALFLGVLWLIRSFIVSENENASNRLKKMAQESVGSPPNVVELVENVFSGMRGLVAYQWAALHSRAGEDQVLRLRGEIDGDQITVYGLLEEPKLSASSPIRWPAAIEPGKGVHADREMVIQEASQLVTFKGAPVDSSAWKLPARTAVMILPVADEGGVIGLLALARPVKLFTLDERERARALSHSLGARLRIVQENEDKLRELYKEIEDFGDPQRTEGALDELLRLKVDVSALLAAISERTFQKNLHAVLQGFVAGQGRGQHIDFPMEGLKDIYGEVQSKKSTMPPWSDEIGERLQTVTSALTLAFSVRYRWPDVARSPDYEDFFTALLRALEARTIPDMIRQRKVILQTRWALTRSSLAARRQLCAQLDKLLATIRSLKKVEKAGLAARIDQLNKTIQSLQAYERSVQDELLEPERFSMIRVLTVWQTTVTNALYAAQEGEADLSLSLGSNLALPLEKIAVRLWVENRGYGLAVGVVAEMESCPDYQVLGRARVEMGPLPAGSRKAVDFGIAARDGCEVLHPTFHITYRDWQRRERHTSFGERLYLGEKPPAFVAFDNPYVAGHALGPGDPLFMGRADIRRFVEQNLSQQTRRKQTLLLMGERRTGKTSIIRQLPEWLDPKLYVCASFDGQSLVEPGLSSFFLSLSGEIARGLTAAGFSIQSPAPAAMKEHPQYTFEQVFLPQVWGQIGDRALLLAVDEFEVLEQRVRDGRLDPEVFPYLRSLMQTYDRLFFLFVGTHRVGELASDYWSILFNMAKIERVSFLDRESAIRLITQPVCRYGVVYDNLAIEEILHLTAGHPYFVQMVCDCLMEYCLDHERSYVTAQNVRDVRNDILKQGQQHLAFVWEQSSPAEKVVLAALTSLLVCQKPVTASDILQHVAERSEGAADRVDFDLAVVNGALERLVRREIVQESDNESPAYGFTADLYRQLVARYRSLPKVLPGLVKTLSRPFAAAAVEV